MHQGSVLSPLIFAIVVDVVTGHAREGLLNEISYANDLMLMSESLEDFISFHLVAYLSSYHEKAINALYELA